MTRVPPDIEAFEERAAIAEHDGGLTRAAAENVAAREQGYDTADAYWAVLADYVIHRRLPWTTR